MKKITKAIIPAAGFGTRLLPATKSVPKELFPIINIPTIQYIVEEAVNSGIKEIILIVSSSKKAIIEYFQQNKKLENELLAKKKTKLYDIVRKVSKLAKIRIIYQKIQNGLGDAIGCASSILKNEPFAVLLGDDVIISKKITALSQCIKAYELTGSSIVGVQEVEKKDVSKYGIISFTKKVKKNIFKINDLIEKPCVDNAPSRYGILGRYILTPNIFNAIKKTKKDKSGEIQITNALKILLKMKKNIYACNFEGTRYDLGNKLGIVKATIDFALNDDEIKYDVKKYIKQKR